MAAAARTEPWHRDSERGTAAIEGLTAFVLVMLVVAFGVQTVLWVHARSVAQTAAQEGARSAAVAGPGAGVARANAVLRAAGGTAERMRAVASTNTDGEAAVSVSGSAPRVFAVSLLMPEIATRASLPVERFPEEERR
jgi:hypothetical protein